MTRDAFLEERGGTFVPSAFSRGPWSADSLHGRVVAGLLARELERVYGDEDLHFARLTVDLFRLPRMAPLEVGVESVRKGRRIRVTAGAVTSEGREIARATAIQLRRGERPAGSIWRPEPWDVPRPEDIETPPPRTAGWAPAWETRPIGGPAFGGGGRKRAWLREIRELVAGERLTPFVRVALAADIASPMSNSGDQGLGYVNADITLYLHRLPEDEWLGWEVSSHQDDAGVAVGSCTIYDERGAIGISTVCAVASTRSD